MKTGCKNYVDRRISMRGYKTPDSPISHFGGDVSEVRDDYRKPRKLDQSQFSGLGLLMLKLCGLSLSKLSKKDKGRN